MRLSIVAPESVLLIVVFIGVWLLLFTSVAVQIYLYQGVSVALAALTIWSAMSANRLWAALLALIPIGLAIFVPTLLRRIGGANAFEPSGKAITFPLRNSKRVVYLLFSIFLLVTVLGVITQVTTEVKWTTSWREIAGLMLILMGLCLWLVRAELTSQCVGMLLMDHGLFLLAEPLVLQFGMSTVVPVVLSLYLLVPFTYLFVVLPSLLQIPLGLDADQHRNLRG